MSVTASIVVHFGAAVSSSAFAAAALDWQLNVDQAGEEITSFAPGDELHFLVQHDASLRIDRVRATAGQVVAEGLTRRAVEQALSFAEAGQAETLTWQPAGQVTRDWQQGKQNLNAREGTGFAVTDRQATVSGGLPCYCLATYPAQFHLYRFICPRPVLGEDESCVVVIHVYMEPV